jgi:hypothetical protein
MRGVAPSGALRRSGATVSAVDVGEPDWLQPSRLELLADEAGIGPRYLREWLEKEIERRMRHPVLSAREPEHRDDQAAAQ